MDCYDACPHGECESCLESILAEISTERHRQDEKWGGREHDDRHSTDEFVQWIQDYAGWARMMASMQSMDKARRRLIQVAALSVAAIQSMSRKAASESSEAARTMGHR